MRTTLLRIAKHGGLVAAGLWIFGILFGQLAGLMIDSQAPVRNGPVLTGEPVNPQAKSEGTLFAERVRWRVAFAMAGWGFLLVAAFELLAGIWRRPPVPLTPVDPQQAKADEELMQLLLRDTEFKATNLSNTPAPVGELKNASESPA
jgi:hypothetical protein